MTTIPVIKQLPLVVRPRCWILYHMDENSIPACVDAWHKRADPIAAIDYGFHMNITHFDQQVADEIPELSELGNQLSEGIYCIQ